MQQTVPQNELPARRTHLPLSQEKQECLQLPQSRFPPQPSGYEPQIPEFSQSDPGGQSSSRSAKQVVGVQPHTPGVPPPAQVWPVPVQASQGSPLRPHAVSAVPGWHIEPAQHPVVQGGSHRGTQLPF